MNVPSALHCSGCGHGLGLEPIGRDGDFRCFDCDVLLDSFEGGPGRLWDCGRCGGQFVDHALLRDLIQRRQIYGTVAPRRLPKDNPFAQPLRYVKCPVCDALMHRRNFAGRSGVIVDVCARHGVWFDAGELPKVLAFVEAGGLARARHEELERLARRPTPLTSQSAARRAPILWADHEASVLEDVGAGAAALLRAVLRLLGRS